MSLVDAYDLTEAANAERFRDFTGGDFLFDKTSGTWCHWDGDAWRSGKDDRATWAMREAIQYMQMQLGLKIATMTASPQVNTEVSKTWGWISRSQSQATLRASLALASQMEELQCSEWDSNPFELSVNNGILNLKVSDPRRRIRPRVKTDRVLRRVGVDYVPEADCPRFKRYLKETLDDDSLVHYVHKAVGYTLTGMTGEQVMFFCLGEGRNGKSMLFQVLERLLGSYCTVAGFSTFTRGHSQQTFDIAMLKDVRLVTSSEPGTESKWDEARIKYLTGGDTVTAAHKYGHPFTFRPRFKLWVMANKFVDTEDYTEGFWRRIRPIMFSQEFEVDGGALEAELKEEASGILNWALEGLERYYADGYKGSLWVPDSMRDLMENYKVEQLEGAKGQVKEFIKERLEEYDIGRVSASEIYLAYQAWARGRIPYNEQPKQNGLSRQVRAHGFRMVRSATATTFAVKFRPVVTGTG